MTNYLDATHIDGKRLTPEEVGGAMHHKKFGIDAREAVAQGLKYYMRQTQEVDVLGTEVKNLDERIAKPKALPSEVADIKQDIVGISIEITKLGTTVFGDGVTAVHTISSGEDNHSQIAEEMKLD